MSTVSVDVPAIITGSDSGIGGDANSISDKDTSTFILPSESELGRDPLYVYVQYGEGAGRFNWALPPGATLVSMQYVALAYREADVAFDATPVTSWTPEPTANPWLSLEASDRADKLALPELVVTTSWSDALDELVVDEPDPGSVLTDDRPMDKLTAVEWSTSATAVAKCAYLALRVTYTTAGGLHPMRKVQRSDGLAGSSARRFVQTSSRQASHRRGNAYT